MFLQKPFLYIMLQIRKSGTLLYELGNSRSIILADGWMNSVYFASFRIAFYKI